MPTDPQLLSRYVENGDEGAFRELVQRHLSLVYFAALRRTGRADWAEEIAQYVFTALARDAKPLRRHTAITGWLYTTTRFASAKRIRSEFRREKREKELMYELAVPEPPDADWNQLRPMVDSALDGLSVRDREAILLRFFEGQSFAEIGTAMRSTQDAARMRVERALDKLQSALRRQGITSTATALAAILAGQAAGASVPSGLAATVSSVALGAGGAAGVTGGMWGLFHYMSTAKIVSGVAVVVAIAATAVSIQQYRTTHQLGAEMETLRAEVAVTKALRAENERLTAEKAAAEKEAQVAHTEVARIREAIAAKRAAATNASARATANTGSSGEPGSKAGPLATGMTSLDVMQDVGRGTPAAAAQTLAYAISHGEIKTAASVLEFEAADRAKIEAFIDGLPEAARAKFSSPEEIVALAMAGTPKPIAGVQLLNRSHPDADTEIQTVQLQYTSGEVKQTEIKFRRESDGWKQVVSSEIVDRVVSFFSARK